jgi:hypothetical protein
MMIRKRGLSVFLVGVATGLASVFLWCLPAGAVDLKLGWDPNSEPDLEGYAIYLKKNSVPGNKNLYGHVALEDLEDPNSPSETIGGLENNQIYHIALKAYNAAGNYSDFSDPICVQITDNVVGLCSETDAADGGGSAEGGSGSGNGGGGCFIASAAESVLGWAAMIGALPLLFIGAFGFRTLMRWKR